MYTHMYVYIYFFIGEGARHQGRRIAGHRQPHRPRLPDDYKLVLVLMYE